MTIEERVETLETTTHSQGERLERHSKRLEKLERSNECLQEIQQKVVGIDTRMKKVETRQTIMENKILKKNNFILALLFVVIGLLGYIAVKSPETAKEVISISGTAVTEGFKTLN